MRLVLIGGAGVVGQALLPQLAGAHDIVVLDRHPAALPGVAVRVGDARDEAVLREVIPGADGVVHLAAVVPRGAQANDAAVIRAAFDVNVTSVYLALRVATAAEVGHFVHFSTMSVYRTYGHTPVDLGAPPDSLEPYGRSKRLAEQVCEAFALAGPMTITSLRLGYATTAALWPTWRSPGTPAATPRRPRLDDGTTYDALAPDDLVRALEAALARTGGYLAAAVTGDLAGVALRNDPTGTLLGWRPQHTGRPQGR